jgi:DNA segregation ATPase FtsK/SpoIIIE-like protein
MSEVKRFEQQHQIQSMRIEQVFGRNQIDAQVTHGTASADQSRYHVQGQLGAVWQRLGALKRDFVRALGVADVAVTPTQNGAQVDVVQAPTAAAPLLSLMERFPTPAPLHATVGLGDDGKPVYLDLNSAENAHTLIVGGQDAGKSTMLNAIAVSLALTNRQSRVQMTIIDPRSRQGKPSLLRPLSYLPHLMLPVVDNAQTALEALQFLSEEADYRIRRRRQAPMIVVLIDRFELLLHFDAEQTRQLTTRLLQKGGDAGIRVVISTRSARADVLDNLVKSYLATRLVGQVADETEAYAATGLRSSYIEEQLVGKGDFVTVRQGKMAYFQGAHLAEHEMLWSLQQLETNLRYTPRLLAQPHVARPTLPREPVTEVVTPFVVNQDGELSMYDREEEPVPAVMNSGLKPRPQSGRN